MKFEDCPKFKELESKRNNLEKEYELAKKEYEVYKFDIKFHEYENIECAMDRFDDLIYELAEESCAGQYNMGDDEYFFEFTVDGKKYKGKIEVTYNRHDKTYYYVENKDHYYMEDGSEEWIYWEF